MHIQLVGDFNQIFSFIMAHLHCEYLEKDRFCGLFAVCCSYNVMLFKGSDCVFRYHIHIALSRGFPVTVNDKDSFLFNVQFTHCVYICERAPLWDIHKPGRDREMRGCSILADCRKEVQLVKGRREANSRDHSVKEPTWVWDGMDGK